MTGVSPARPKENKSEPEHTNLVDSELVVWAQPGLSLAAHPFRVSGCKLTERVPVDAPLCLYAHD